VFFDKVTIERSETEEISGTFYIGIFNRVRTAYQVKVEVEYGPLYHQLL